MVVGCCLVLYFILWFCGCRCRLRNIGCVRRCLRCTGVDRFDDFEIETIVHEVQYPGRNTEKKTLIVRIVAGHQHIQTEASNDGRFHETLDVLVVEQGVPTLDVCLCDSGGRVVYRAKLDPKKDLLDLPAEALIERDLHLREKVGSQRGMKLGQKVTVKLTFKKPGQEGAGNKVTQRAAEEGRELTLSTQLHFSKVASCLDPGADELRILARACAGPVELTENQGLRAWRWGKKRSAWFAAVGPPVERRWILGLWPDEVSWQEGQTGEMEFEVMSTSGVSPDPHSANVFGVRYMSNGIRQELRLGHVDRSRDVWVEVIQLFVERIHATKRKRGDRGGGALSSDRSRDGV